MSEPTLKCPHCGNPVAFSPAVAGRVVACPHCRGQFQMPASAPASAPATRQKLKTEPIPERELGYKSEPLPSAGGSAAVERVVRAELGSYRAATALANGFAIVGTFAVILTAVLMAVVFVLPQFREPDGQPRSLTAAVLWMISVFVFTFFGIMGLFLARACVLVGVDAARTVRAIERDAYATRSNQS
ncbi:TFIIB-type zinc ribbon-containing protein [Zavarzinella formosa]|uniref:hypothetical protein n=1 Tax=Zavarzinella formosa TaxID=360055 RepID=UPI0003201033|nr:hypothetical protein [Zavarzinella formosa]